MEGNSQPPSEHNGENLGLCPVCFSLFCVRDWECVGGNVTRVSSTFGPFLQQSAATRHIGGEFEVEKGLATTLSVSSSKKENGLLQRGKIGAGFILSLSLVGLGL